MNNNTKNEKRKQVANEYEKSRSELLGPYHGAQKSPVPGLWLTPELAELRAKVMDILLPKTPEYEKEIPHIDIKTHIMEFAKFITQNEQLITDTSKQNSTVIEALISLLDDYYSDRSDDIT